MKNNRRTSFARSLKCRPLTTEKSILKEWPSDYEIHRAVYSTPKPIKEESATPIYYARPWVYEIMVVPLEEGSTPITVRGYGYNKAQP